MKKRRKEVSYGPIGPIIQFPPVEARSARVELTGFLGEVDLYEGNKLLTPRKKQTSNRLYERKTRLDMVFSAPTVIERTRLTTPGASVHIMSKHGLVVPMKTNVSYRYERRNGKEKVLVKFFLRDEVPCADSAVFLRRFDSIHAVDTNAIEVPGVGRIGVTAVVTTRPIGTHNDSAMIQGATLECAEYETVPENFERIGWRAALEMLDAREERGRLALIVDSGLDELEGIRDREIAMVDDFFLPQNVDIIYATDASGSQEYLPCLLIRMAENYAREKLDALVAIALADSAAN